LTAVKLYRAGTRDKRAGSSANGAAVNPLRPGESRLVHDAESQRVSLPTRKPILSLDKLHRSRTLLFIVYDLLIRVLTG
jgi:hypothetical protein